LWLPVVVAVGLTLVAAAALVVLELRRGLQSQVAPPLRSLLALAEQALQLPQLPPLEVIRHFLQSHLRVVAVPQVLVLGSPIQAVLVAVDGTLATGKT
jgi:hypothetical protein